MYWHKVYSSSLVISVASAIALTGCGGGSSYSPAIIGGGNTVTPVQQGTVAFNVTWPVRNAIIPLASNSIAIAVKDSGGNVVAQGLIAYPATSYTTSALNDGTYTYVASAYPTTSGTGTAQARGTAQVAVGSTLSLTATCTDASSNTVLVAPGTVAWSGGNSFGTVNASDVVTGVAAGTVPVTATFNEVDSATGQTPEASSIYSVAVTSSGNSGLTTYPFTVGYAIRKIASNGALLAEPTFFINNGNPLLGYYSASYMAPYSNWSTFTPVPSGKDGVGQDMTVLGGTATIVGESGNHNSGDFVFNSQEKPVYWTSATNPTPLQLGAATYGWATSINASGEVAGVLGTNIVTWANVGAAPIVLAPATPTIQAINAGSYPVVLDNGTVIDFAAVSNGINVFRTYPAGGGAATDHSVIDPPFGALAWNGQGLVVGSSYVAGLNFTKFYPAYLSSSDGFVEHKLPLPAGAGNAYAQAVSSSGMIAGAVYYTNNAVGVLLWKTPSSSVDLQSTMPAGYVLNNADAFLPDGNLLCYGTVNGAGKLIEVPIP